MIVMEASKGLLPGWFSALLVIALDIISTALIVCAVLSLNC